MRSFSGAVAISPMRRLRSSALRGSFSLTNGPIGYRRSIIPPVSADALFFPHGLEQLDLPRVVHVVQSDPRDLPQSGTPARPRKRPRQVPGRQLRDRLAQRAVLALEQVPLEAPRLLVRARELEPVVPVHREGPAFFPRQPPAHAVFPVCRVHGELPDVVPARGRAPRRLPRRDAAKRALACRPVPCALVVGLVQRVEQDGDLAVRPCSSTLLVHAATSFRCSCFARAPP